jgi:hypothetical protein
MSHVHKLSTIIKYNKSKQKLVQPIGFVLCTIAGGLFTFLLTQHCCKKCKNDTNTNEKHSDEDKAIIISEIKQAAEKVEEEAIGDVGVAIEKAIENLENT